MKLKTYFFSVDVRVLADKLQLVTFGKVISDWSDRHTHKKNMLLILLTIKFEIQIKFTIKT